MIIKTDLYNIDYVKLIFIAIWYACWLPICGFVIYIIITDKTNLFLYVWLIFGALGLVIVPLSIVDLFTKYTFEESDTSYIVTIKSLFKTKTITFKKTDFQGFKFDIDSDGQRMSYNLEYKDHYRNNVKIPILYWQKDTFKIEITERLKWKSAQQGDTPEPATNAVSALPHSLPPVR